MSTLNHLAIRLYRRLFARDAAPAAAGAGIDAVLDGLSAVALTEAGITPAATFGGTFPVGDVEALWRQEAPGACATVAEGPRGALAAAMGQALAGQRTALFLSGPDLAAAHDLLANAAGRHLPLVLHLASRALPAHGEGRGTGHEALHLSAESGAVVLIAANVQEAADLTLIAHRIAELALVPVVVAQDGELTALSVQEVRLPTTELIERFLGAPEAEITAPTAAQEMLFGETRRRVPRWHDLDQPMLTGARQPAELFALGAAATATFFAGHLEAIVDEAFAEFTHLTGRPYGRLALHRMEGADRVLLVQGGAAEAARAAADRLAGQRKGGRVGVVALRCLRPAPGAQLVEQLAGRKAVAVLERRDSPLAGDPPLLRELRGALDRAQENHRYGADTHPGYLALDERRRPRLHTALYGSGGLPLRGTDLLALCQRLEAGAPARLFLGIDFHAPSGDHPKRQVMLDQLRRAYPQAAALGLKGEAGSDLAPADALALALLRREGSARALVGDAAALLRRLDGGIVRGLPGLDGAPWLRDRLLHAAGGGYVGDDLPLDLVMATGGESGADLCAGLRPGGILLLAGDAADGEPGGAFWDALGSSCHARIRELGARLYCLPSESVFSTAPRDPLAAELADARMLGGLFAALIDGGRLEQSRRKVVSGWKEQLATLPEEERDALLAAFEAGYDALRPLEYRHFPELKGTEHRREETPLAVRHLGGGDDTFESLPRFWDQVGVLFRGGESGRLTADPYMATGAIPPLSATFRDLSGQRDMLPRFDAAACSGCGECWSACPDSAIGAVALTPQALINAGIQAVKGDPLRPLVTKLAARLSAMGRGGELGNAPAAELLRRAWTAMLEKAPLAEERLAAVTPAAKALFDWAGDLPLAATDLIFGGGEREKRDSGELLSLAINPDACKGCGLCVAACGESALVAAPQEAEGLAAARSVWRTWQATPDTGSHTIERLMGSEGITALAALLLSRYCAMAMAGGDPAEAGSGEKIALRLLLAATEYQQQPLLHRFTAEVGEARGRVNDLIRETLAGALPGDDLDALARQLGGAEGRQVDLAQLGGLRGVETARLRRLVTLARGLDEQFERLSSGRYGLGRARYSLAVTSGSVAAWAGTFPNNPFQAPVTLEMTGDPMFAGGLVSGQLQEALRPLELLRQVREELEGGEGGAPLSWERLPAEQRRLCAPLIVAGSEAELGGRGLAQVAWLLNSGLPVKILVLSELDLGLDTRATKSRPLATRNDPRTDLGLMALAQRNAYVAQTGIGDTDHFRTTVREALRFTGPALIRVHAPSPQRHGFAPEATVERARQAVRGRAFPLFRYHPEGEGVFGSRLTLEGNPEPHAAWAGEGGLNPLPWAAGETRFAAHFPPLAEDAPAPVEALAWLALDATARTKKTPYVALGDGEEARRYRVSPELLAQVERLGHAWRTLQELAGVVTPFTERVRAEAQARVAADHEAALEEQRADYEARLQALEAGMQGEISGQIKARLMALAGY